MLQPHIGARGPDSKALDGGAGQGEAVPMKTGNSSRWLLASALAAFATAGAAALTAQAGEASPGPKNLQVLPKDMPRAELIGVMKGFTVALGVKCTHCHVETGGKMDFAADAKTQKETARAMIRMVHALNAETFKVADMKQAKVTCFTCHRGAVKPLTKPEASAS